MVSYIKNNCINRNLKIKNFELEIQIEINLLRKNTKVFYIYKRYKRKDVK